MPFITLKNVTPCPIDIWIPISSLQIPRKKCITINMDNICTIELKNTICDKINTDYYLITMTQGQQFCVNKKNITCIKTSTLSAMYVDSEDYVLIQKFCQTIINNQPHIF